MSSDPLTQARDRIAELCGYTRPQGGMWWTPTEPCRIGADGTNNPIPACLNFVSKVWPEGWWWAKEQNIRDGTFCWCAGPRRSLRVKVPASGPETSDRSETSDRLLLLQQVLDWLKATDPPAFAAAVEKIRKEIRG